MIFIKLYRAKVVYYCPRTLTAGLKRGLVWHYSRDKVNLKGARSVFVKASLDFVTGLAPIIVTVTVTLACACSSLRTGSSQLDP